MGRKNKELKRLIRDQERDNSHNYQYREIIPLQKPKPYTEIKDLETRAIVVLYKSQQGFSFRKLGQIFNKDKDTISSIISRTFDDFPHLK